MQLHKRYIASINYLLDMLHVRTIRSTVAVRRPMRMLELSDLLVGNAFFRSAVFVKVVRRGSSTNRG
jgi:hypothetical protein